MSPRATWKGHLTVGEVSCAVALYTAVSTSDRISLHTLNRATGNRVRRQYVDSVTGDAVARDEQVKGYETASGTFLMLEPDDLAAAVPAGDKTIAIETFITCADIDDVYFDKPYYLAPADSVTAEAFALVRDGMRAKKVAAVGEAVLFRRVRKLLIRPHGDGLIATLLNFDYEVRSARDAFSDIADLSIKGEMLDLAEHIIKTKAGSFDPRTFDDRYEAALSDLVKAKLSGEPLPKRAPPRDEKVVDLMEALRASAGGATAAGGAKAKRSAKSAPAGAAKTKAGAASKAKARAKAPKSTRSAAPARPSRKAG
ncbi:MAG: Ku protein [Rhizobiales bacterium 32-66-8]|nr:MAG: Ku protein [Rhizobiales bacterium 32-66-8]